MKSARISPVAWACLRLIAVSVPASAPLCARQKPARTASEAPKSAYPSPHISKLLNKNCTRTDDLCCSGYA
jgi:hypothetical protein